MFINLNLEYLINNKMSSIETYYMYLCNTTSDINEHLPTLKEYASNVIL